MAVDDLPSDPAAPPAAAGGGTQDAVVQDAVVQDAVALVEPARQKVVGVAATVLGRLPSEDVPSGLRAIARFTPAKRQRLGGVAIAAALDADGSFREHVAAAVAQSSPELVEAVRAGRSTAAADPLDVAVIAYLTRPDGWTDTVAEANRRWTDERGGHDDAAEEVARLRAELAEWRARARAEPARLRDAVADAAGRAEAEAAQLRRTVRERTRDLRVAERDRDEARQAEAESAARQRRREATHDAEVRRLRARLGELERVTEAARRDVRAGRDIDDARLWLLVDTLVQAAGGVRRELSLPPPSARPADVLISERSATPEVSGRTVRDAAELDRLLTLPNVHLVIDGYNVTKTGYGALPLEQQRARLVGALAPLAAQSGAEVTVAFDGAARPPVQPPAPRGVRVLFSAADEIADDLIRRLVAAEPPGRPVVVVTSDREIVTDTGRHGAWAVASAVFLTRVP